MKVYIGLGSNINNRLALLYKAKYLIEEQVGHITKESKVYVTEPWGLENQAEFYNQVICVETEMKPTLILKTLLAIEVKMGRVRALKWGARKIDIDILMIDDLVIEKTKLTVPHSRMQHRNFVLRPFAEIAPEIIHPIFKVSIQELLESTTDQKEVYILASNEPTDST